MFALGVCVLGHEARSSFSGFSAMCLTCGTLVRKLPDGSLASRELVPFALCQVHAQSRCAAYCAVFEQCVLCGHQCGCRSPPLRWPLSRLQARGPRATC